MANVSIGLYGACSVTKLERFEVYTEGNEGFWFGRVHSRSTVLRSVYASATPQLSLADSGIREYSVQGKHSTRFTVASKCLLERLLMFSAVCAA